MEARTSPILRAKQPGRGGRKHILAQTRVTSNGEIQIHMGHPNAHCGCEGWYSWEEIASVFEQARKQIERKEAA